MKPEWNWMQTSPIKSRGQTFPPQAVIEYLKNTKVKRVDNFLDTLEYAGHSDSSKDLKE